MHTYRVCTSQVLINHQIKYCSSAHYQLFSTIVLIFYDSRFPALAILL